ncbi:tetratricopeptide repeat protein [Sinosporangium siamense]|uniref:tetratricopeptide repeat protein n=1 Tax=Sinosporangium siamense TaxID=1367973 RepID=UPI00195011B5|nr:tetratricopeptide repeat protein [Sinosporangium siamense]
MAPLLLERWRTQRAAHSALERLAELGPNSAPALLLNASEAVVPFTGRDRELAELLAWCSDPDAGRLRLLVGPGGVGKSRLAAELARQLDRSWRFLPVADEAEAEVLSRLREVSGGRLLLVVDYAETRTGLASLLNEAAADEGRQVRVLLVARSAGEWWRQLGGQSARVRQMVAAAGQGIVLTEQVGDGISDIELVLGAVPYFAQRLGVEIPTGVKVEPGVGPHRVLDLHAAALVAVLRSIQHGSDGAGAISVGMGDVLEELLGHERRFWLRSAQARGFTGGVDGLSALVVEQTVAVGTLLGAHSRAEAVKLVGRVPDGTVSGAVADWLRELYPPQAGDGREWFGQLRPDRLAELHVTRQLSDSPALLMGCLEGLDGYRERRALMMLARAAQELDEAREILHRLLPELANEVGGLIASRETLRALHDALPSRSLILGGARVLLAKRLLDSVPDKEDVAEKAHWLDALVVHLSHVGHLFDALAAAREAVTIYRELARLDPDRHYADLAHSLANLGACLSELNHPAEALAVAREAVTISRELARLDPDRHRADLADTLHMLGNCLSELNHPAEALAAAQEAATIYRELARVDADRHRADLARSLANLSIYLSAIGNNAKAQSPAKEAATIYRELARLNPDRHRADLARSLANLSIYLSAIGNDTEALAAAREAVTISRELARLHPDRHRALLADTLNILGNRLSELNYPAEALAAAREAVTISRELARPNPDRHGANLAHFLYNLGFHLSKVGRLAEAITAEQRAVTIRRKLARLDPDRHRADLAHTLNNLGCHLLQVDRLVEALPASKKAVTIYRELVRQDPDRYRYDLAYSLYNLSYICVEDDSAEADKLTEEANHLLDEG